MIVVKLMGGLGNQMFQYALGRALADEHRTDLKLDISWFKSVEDTDTVRVYELDCFPIRAKLSGSQGIGWLDKRRVQNYSEKSMAFQPEVLKLPDNTYLEGYWQNENYFKKIRASLLVDFTPAELSSYTKQLAATIDKGNFVGLHVRRGDYASNKLTNKFHGLTPLDYYRRSIELMKNKLNDLKFLVSSDDIDWCKQNLSIEGALFIEPDGARYGYEDMYLLSKCRHNIIANSSFSWWGAWLNQSSDKVVVAPKVWFADKKANAEIDNIPEDWIRL